MALEFGVRQALELAYRSRVLASLSKSTGGKILADGFQEACCGCSGLSGDTLTFGLAALRLFEIGRYRLEVLRQLSASAPAKVGSTGCDLLELTECLLELTGFV